MNLFSERVLFREKELELLSRFIGRQSRTPFPSFYICGHSSSGKTFLISEFLKEFDIRYALINCYEASTIQLLLTSIINKVLNNVNKEISCNSLCDFCNMLKEGLKDETSTTVIVLDNAEVLRSKHSSVLPVLARLQELTRLNICVIFISDILWEKFRSTAGAFDPIIIYLSDYTKEELVEILCLDCPSNYSKEFYESYANIIMKVFFMVTRNLNELRHIAKLNFPKYCEPVISGDVDENNVHKLFKYMEPTLKDAVHAIYLREVSGPKWNSLLKESQNLDSKTDLTSIAITSKYHMTKELPFYSKFLLIACYFASYNSPKSDFKHFVKNQGKQRKKSVRKKAEKNRHLLGPKAFTLDRLLSIFFAIVGSGVQPSALILSQISSLVSLRLVARVSLDEQLDTPKYKCLAELDLIRNIGKTVNIDVMSYLDDFI